MDELALRRFNRAAASVARKLAQYDKALMQLNEAALSLEALLNTQIDMIERVSGETASTQKIRAEIAQAWNVFNDDKAIPAIEAVLQHFDTASVELGELVGALPKK
jgi:signal transduction histidine kinase